MNRIGRRHFLAGLGAGTSGLFASRGVKAASAGAKKSKNPKPAAKRKRVVYTSGRDDGRFISSTAFIHAYLKHLEPKLAFDPTMPRDKVDAWRDAVRDKLRELMRFPDIPPQPQPKRIWTKQRKGYRLERWEAYPEPFSVVPFLVLIPDGVSKTSPAPAALCCPGSSSSKENLAGELELNGKPSPKRHGPRNMMAMEYTQKGIVTVAVDNPGTCETADKIRPGRYELSMHGIWAGRPYEALSVFQKHHILEWLKRQPYVDTARIATSGHSLGAKPALILGVLDPTIKAIVWNDFLSDWRRRAIVTNLRRISIWQYVPDFLAWFDYVDLHASLAPRPLLVSEGGRTRDIERVREAYRLLGAEDQFKVVYYPKYATPDRRPYDDVDMPEGLTLEEFFPYANVDVPMHHFKGTVAVPWLAKTLGV